MNETRNQLPDVVQKLWGFCHVLRHDGIGYGDYIEQITFLLYLKMAEEKRVVSLPRGCGWKILRGKSGTDLLDSYVDMLRALGKAPGLIGDIYAGGQSRFKNPANLKQLIGTIDETEWTSLGVDVKAAAYEGLLEKAASEGKKGVGGIFTPRLLIQSIVRCVKPDPRAHKEFTICDPACGTGGFLVAAYEWLLDRTGGGALDREMMPRIRNKTYHGQDIVDLSRRLALMNLTLHGLEPEIKLGDSIYEVPGARRFDVVLTNPPFGTKGANQAPTRDDFTISTSNKQLNFLQHVMTILKPGGRAAVVLPDNCLFADQAGEVFEILTQDCDVHTVLRLPRGTFSPYSQGVKANVIFFANGTRTENVWIYDGRTNVEGITKKDRPLAAEHFAQFERCYGATPNGRARRKPDDSKEDRWRSFHISEVKKREFKLDSFKWLKDESLEGADELPSPEELATDTIAELESAVEELNEVLKLLEGGGMAKPLPHAPKSAAQEIKGLPDGWACAPLADIALIKMGQSPPGTTYNQTGVGLPFFQGKVDFGDLHPRVRVWCSAPVKIAEVGDVLISVRAPVGPTNVADRQCAIGRGLAAISPVGGIPTSFINYVLRSKARILEAQGTGSTFTAIGQNVLRNVEIEVPPLAEQKRIVAKIEALEARANVARERLTKLPAMLKRFRQSVLAAACSGKLTEDLFRGGDESAPDKLLHTILRERESSWERGPYAAPVDCDDSNLPDLPDGWIWCSFDTFVCDSFYGPRFSGKTYVKDGIPTIRTTDIEFEGRIILKNPPRLKLDANDLEKFCLQDQDLLMTRTGATIGKCALYSDDVGPAIPSAY